MSDAIVSTFVLLSSAGAVKSDTFVMLASTEAVKFSKSSPSFSNVRKSASSSTFFSTSSCAYGSPTLIQLEFGIEAFDEVELDVSEVVATVGARVEFSGFGSEAFDEVELEVSEVVATVGARVESSEIVGAGVGDIETELPGICVVSVGGSDTLFSGAKREPLKSSLC